MHAIQETRVSLPRVRMLPTGFQAIPKYSYNVDLTASQGVGNGCDRLQRHAQLEWSTQLPDFEGQCSASVAGRDRPASNRPAQNANCLAVGSQLGNPRLGKPGSLTSVELVST